MNNELIYLLSEKLYSNATVDPLCNRSWLFSIYKSLLVTNKNDNKPIVWTKYNQWQIDHNCRASKSAALENKTVLESYTINLINESEAEIKGRFFKNSRQFEETFNYSRKGFVSDLWETKNPNGATILMSAYERDKLFESSLDPVEFIDKGSEIHDTQTLISEILPPKLAQPTSEKNTLVSAQEKKARPISKPKKEKDEHARKMKFIALKKLLDRVRDEYKSMDDPQQKSYIEVVIGAAIFYLPTHHTHFSGYISIEALRGYKHGNRLVKDHIFPRKLAAKELLGKSFSLEELMAKYHDELSQFMYVTSRENSLLVNYYETHDSHDDALASFQIGKFPVNKTEKFSTHKELSSFLAFIEDKRTDKSSLDDLMRFLREFRVR